MPNKELIKYIKTEEAQGYTPAQLKKVLLGQGWPKKDVDEAIKYADKKNILPAKTSSKKQRPTSITVIAILYFISGSLGFLYTMYLMVSGEAAILSNPLLADNPIAASIASIAGTMIIVTSLIGAVLNLFNIVIGWGLWTLKNWARIIAIIQSILVMITIVGLPIGIIFLIFLVKKTTKQAFGK